jgi:hypothetical protein
MFVADFFFNLALHDEFTPRLPKEIKPAYISRTNESYIKQIIRFSEVKAVLMLVTSICFDNSNQRRWNYQLQHMYD